MFKLPGLIAFFLALCTSIASACGGEQATRARNLELGYLQISSDITLRRMVAHSPTAAGTVLLLHGFPETLCVWKDIALQLAPNYEIHAIDWPGYGFSSRPPARIFSYAPKEYARVLQQYVEKAGIDKASLTIYATDIGALPALLAAIEDPHLAKTIIVGDFAPFDRPQYMYESLQSLKSEHSAAKTHDYMNRTSNEILENAFRRGLSVDAQFAVSSELKHDLFIGWNHGELTSADAFFHYYSKFTQDQQYFEANIGKLRTPVRIVWGEEDIYIKKDMGVELAKKIGAELTILPEIGHYPHLQDPEKAIEEIRATFR
jgi:pimeloyl-ACP methyl ester carboxylesterase